MRSPQVRNITKSLQRSVYTFSTSKYGAFFLVIFAFITLNSLLHLIQQFVSFGIVNKTILFGDECTQSCDKLFNDNVGKVNVKNTLCFNQPMDIVYTWVNGSDPIHLRDLAYYKSLLEKEEEDDSISSPVSQNVTLVGTAVLNNNDTAKNSTTEAKDNSVSGSNRFRDNEELRYSLRSVEKFAPWVRKIFIVTSGQVPHWLNTQNPKVQIVTHKEIFLNQSHLPTFSSPSIESHLHRIPGLSEHFIYLNDDVMFGNYVYPSDFISVNPNSGGQKVFLSWDIPDCAPGCSANWIGDGYCDSACNVSSCDYDGGDCKGVFKASSTSESTSSWANWNSNGNSAWQNEQSKRMSKLCSKSCFDHWIGDKFCDNPCNVPECGYDAGDCGFTKITAELPAVHVQRNDQTFYVQRGVKSLYIDFTQIIPDNASITSGSHDNNDWIRSSTISQTRRIMTITFLKSQDELNSALTSPLVKQDNTTSTSFTTVPTINPDRNVTLTIEAIVSVLDKQTGKNATETMTITVHIFTKDPQQFPEGIEVLADQKKETKAIEKKNDEIVIEEEEHEDAAPISNDKEIDDKSKADVQTQGDTNNDKQNVPNNLENLVKQHQQTKEKLEKLKESNDKIRNMLENQQNPMNNDKNAQKRKKKKTTKKHAELENEAQEINLAHIGGRQLLSMQADISKSHVKVKIIRDPDHGGKLQNSLRYEYQQKMEGLRKQNLVTKSVEKQIVSEKEEKEVKDQGIIRTSPGRRRLLDKFGDSLIHANKYLNARFGRVARKVPAHMPHMIRKSIMQEIADQVWAPQFDKTSSNRFRSSDDMQYAFSYFYYMMHEGKNYSASEFFGELDTNRDGILQNGEVRLLARMMDKKWRVSIKEVKALLSNATISNASDKQEEATPTPISAPASDTTSGNRNNTDNNDPLEEWSSWVRDQSNSNSESSPDPFESFKSYFASLTTLFNVTEANLRSQNASRPRLNGSPDLDTFIASGVSDLVKQQVDRKVNRFEYTLVNLDEVAFHMVQDDYDSLADQLDNVRIRKPKFICLNDDMNHTNPNPDVKNLLHEFFEWFYPTPSSFELPPGERNAQLRVEKLEKHYIKERYVNLLINIIAVLMMVLVCLLMVHMRSKSRKSSVIGTKHMAYDRDTLV